MSNIEQAKQEIQKVILKAGLSFGDLSNLEGFCMQQLWDLIIPSNVKFQSDVKEDF